MSEHKKSSKKKIVIGLLAVFFLIWSGSIVFNRYSSATYDACGNPINNEPGYTKWTVEWDLSINPLRLYRCVYDENSSFVQELMP